MVDYKKSLIFLRITAVVEWVSMQAHTKITSRKEMRQSQLILGKCAATRSLQHGNPDIHVHVVQILDNAKKYMYM